MELENLNREISYDYIRGLIDGEGCFSFCAFGSPDKSGKKQKSPAFLFSMSKRDENLINLVKNRLKLKNKIYSYPPRERRDSYNRQGMSVLIVRDIGQLKNTIVPLCYKKLFGYKGRQFEKWIDQIGNDPYVPKRYKFIHKIYMDGFYDRNPKFID